MFFTYLLTYEDKTRAENKILQCHWTRHWQTKSMTIRYDTIR